VLSTGAGQEFASSYDCYIPGAFQNLESIVLYFQLFKMIFRAEEMLDFRAVM
jgi:hypothetical protein